MASVVFFSIFFPRFGSSSRHLRPLWSYDNNKKKEALISWPVTFPPWSTSQQTSHGRGGALRYGRKMESSGAPFLDSLAVYFPNRGRGETPSCIFPSPKYLNLSSQPPHRRGEPATSLRDESWNQLDTRRILMQIIKCCCCCRRRLKPGDGPRERAAHGPCGGAWLG